MKKKQLKPIEPKDSWSVPLQKILEAIVRDVLYAPLIADFKNETKTNAKGTNKLVDALNKGEVSYQNNLFRAVKWRAELVREMKKLGAKWYKTEAAYMIPRVQLPVDVQEAIRINSLINSQIFKKFMIKIAEMPKTMAERVKMADIEGMANKTADKTFKQYKDTVIKPMGVQPDLTPEQRIYVDEDYIETVTKPIRQTLNKSYSDNVEESMTYFSDEETQKLREIVETHVFAGRPRKELIEKIEGRLHVGYNRAKFIARQETSLYTAKLKESQYKASGIDKYRWMTVGDDAVRHSHKEHNRKVFTWDNPPIVDPLTGRRAHPGEDFNCRCTASPIVEF
jgi:SPP1 gp7 family putative phage head morphogenesis protein